MWKPAIASVHAQAYDMSEWQKIWLQPTSLLTPPPHKKNSSDLDDLCGPPILGWGGSSPPQPPLVAPLFLRMVCLKYACEGARLHPHPHFWEGGAANPHLWGPHPQFLRRGCGTKKFFGQEVAEDLGKWMITGMHYSRLLKLVGTKGWRGKEPRRSTKNVRNFPFAPPPPPPGREFVRLRKSGWAVNVAPPLRGGWPDCLCQS